jgi:hypothetical protein
MSYSGSVIEHQPRGASGWLRARRVRITLWIAAIEGLLYVVNVLNWWAAAALAVIAVAFWWMAGRSHRSGTLRELSWIFATSQLLVLCVPIALAILKAVAIGVVVVIAIAGLILLFIKRPK